MVELPRKQPIDSIQRFKNGGNM